MVEAGGHGLLTFRRQDLIVVSPGVPLDTPELVQVKSFGLPVIGELELAARFLKGKTLAITGSNGKTTTTTLLGEILKLAACPRWWGGNIGVPVVPSSTKAPTKPGRSWRSPASSLKPRAIPSRDRRHSQHHPRPPRPPRQL
jgi:UDP-N-acetylmuramoylalanine-D-glutamate ligase